ncbi:NB-ARC domain-containing protein (plasmid) [Calothrix sp. NIES-4071]|nr:NB-ARC domain-containing protein [Calothrix sp. NIES-4071]BAZ64944.1 NB-ARC domain-containing protein [Calothrix sp. NIES-4105]
MARTSLKLTSDGYKRVDKARQSRGWNKTSPDWKQQCGISQSTLSRFLNKKPISLQNFISVCKAVGIEDWQSIADFERSIDSTIVLNHPTLSKKQILDITEPRYSLTITGIFTEQQRLQVDGIVTLLEKLLSNPYIIVQGKDNDNKSGG